MRSRRSPRTVGALTSGALVLGALSTAFLGAGPSTASAPSSTSAVSAASTVGAAARSHEDLFLAGATYVGTFADPTVLRVGSRYYASATNTSNLNLPIMSSTDLRTWVPRPALEDWWEHVEWQHYNDAMVDAPAWAATRGQRENVRLISQWAPSLAKVGDRYLAAYSAAVRLEPRHSCIGIAVSSSPQGPFRNLSSKPLVCFSRAPLGVIDPEFFVDRGTPYLLWKQEGVPRVSPPKLMARRLAASGTRFARGSAKHVLVQRDQAWEGGVVENPSMVRRQGDYYLLYSGNAWRTSHYATGYAVCATPLGPCRKPTHWPLLRSGGDVAGPGGADAFVDHRGWLRMAYAAFDAGRVGETQPRKLHVATLGLRSGRLVVTSRG